jgi:hypothetical protein
MEKVKFEVYENNGGGLFLVLFDANGEPFRIFENWEYGPDGILADAINQLFEDPDAWQTWDSDLMERLEGEDIKEIYAGLGDLVAWSTDDKNGWDHLPARRLGFAALGALNIKAE